MLKAPPEISHKNAEESPNNQISYRNDPLFAKTSL